MVVGTIVLGLMVVLVFSPLFYAKKEKAFPHKYGKLSYTELEEEYKELVSERKELLERIQGMSEIIHDFEHSVFEAQCGEGFAGVSSNNSGLHEKSDYIETTMRSSVFEDGVRTFTFSLAHPRAHYTRLDIEG